MPAMLAGEVRRFLDRLRGGGAKAPAPDEIDPADMRAMVALRDAGADLWQPRLTRHYLYFATQAAADEAARRLRAEEIDVEVRESPGHGWLALATHTAIVRPATIRDVRRPFEALAADLDGEYDGWEAAVTP